VVGGESPNWIAGPSFLEWVSLWYTSLSLLVSMAVSCVTKLYGNWEGGGLSLCVTVMGGCGGSAVTKYFGPEKFSFRTATAPPHYLHT